MTAKSIILAISVFIIVAFRAFSASPPPSHTQTITWKVGPDFHNPSGFNKFTSWRVFYSRVGPYPDYAVIQDVAYAGGYFTPPVPPEGTGHNGTLYDVLDNSTMYFQWADGDGYTYPELYVLYDCTPSLAFATAGSNPEVWFPDIECVNDVVFSVEPLPADGVSQSQASVTSLSCFPNGAELQILAPDLGCTINSTTGLITAGEVSGTIRVRATDKNVK